MLPVKRLAGAKTRLGAPYDGQRGALALAFALDTTVAALACTRVAAVLVVTDDDTAAARLTALGAEVTGDHPDAGLNPALAHGAALASATRPDTFVGTLAADLPALRPDELAGALDTAAAHERAFVRDATGSGTTLLLARDAATLAPMFGPGSAGDHARSGAVEVVGGVPSLRLDVDTAADLDAARELGVGPWTRAVLDGLHRRPRAG